MCAQKLDINKPHTDEVNYQQQDRTDWYEVELKGKPLQPVLTTIINWDNANSDINVDTSDHIVTLKGTVLTPAGRARAGVVARQTEGVRRVVNNLTISSKSKG